MTEVINLNVSCACGAVAFHIPHNAVPSLQFWCHCKDCQKFHQHSPVGLIAFPRPVLSITKGADNISSLNISKNFTSVRHICKTCGFRLFNEKVNLDRVTFPATSLQADGFKFEPSCHIWAQSATAENLELYKNDGLPKFVDLPIQIGGSGDVL